MPNKVTINLPALLAALVAAAPYLLAVLEAFESTPSPAPTPAPTS